MQHDKQSVHGKHTTKPQDQDATMMSGNFTNTVRNQIHMQNILPNNSSISMRQTTGSRGTASTAVQSGKTAPSVQSRLLEQPTACCAQKKD